MNEARVQLLVRNAPPPPLTSPNRQLGIGISIAAIGLLLACNGFDGAFGSSGAILVAFAIVCARVSLHYSDFMNNALWADMQNSIMRKGYQQQMFNLSVIVRQARQDRDTDMVNESLDQMQEIAETHKALFESEEYIRAMYWKYTDLHSRALTIEASLAVAGTLIWGFGNSALSTIQSVAEYF